jgi:hypothetical protein
MHACTVAAPASPSPVFPIDTGEESRSEGTKKRGWKDQKKEKKEDPKRKKEKKSRRRKKKEKIERKKTEEETGGKKTFTATDSSVAWNHRHQ